MRVLFLPRYGELAGSSRYMTYDYLPYLEKAGFSCTVSPLLDDHYLRVSRALPSKSSQLVKLGPHLLKQMLIRIWCIVTANRYDVIVMEKDVIPYLPYVLDALLFFTNHRVVVMYDERTDSFYDTHPNILVRKLAKNKIRRIMERAAYVIVWNQVVLAFAQSLNENVTELRTGIDLVRYRMKTEYEVTDRPVRIGWIGSPSGYAYIRNIDPVLSELAKTNNIELYVVGSGPYMSDDFQVTNHCWSVETEVDDLRAMDIGIMPLPNTEWAAGKSGCKMFQYMAVALPVVVSPVGINGEVVEHGKNGFLAQTESDWYQYLSQLAKDASLRKRLGADGREYVEAHNSQAVNAEEFLTVLSEVAKHNSHEH